MTDAARSGGVYAALALVFLDHFRRAFDVLYVEPSEVLSVDVFSVHNDPDRHRWSGVVCLNNDSGLRHTVSVRSDLFPLSAGEVVSFTKHLQLQLDAFCRGEASAAPRVYYETVPALKLLEGFE